LHLSFGGDRLKRVNWFRQRIRSWTGLALDENSPQDQGNRRSRSVISGAVSAFLARALAIVVGIAVVPLTVRYLGSERYGVWVTISASLALLSFVDFGLEDSLTNALGRAYGRDEHEIAKRYVSSAFYSLCLIAMVLLAVGWVFVPQLAAFLFSHSEARQIRGEIMPAIAIAYGLFALRFPLLITNRVLAAYQENRIANLWAIAGGVANLTAILVVIWFRGGLPWLVLGSSGLGFLTSVACAIWLFGRHRPWLRPTLRTIECALLKQLFSSGWKFFVIGAGWMINTESDTLIIAHYLGASRVTPFNVTLQLFSVTMVVQTLVMPSLWPAYTEAYARNDFAWIRRAFRSNARLSLISTGFVVMIFVCFGQQIIRVWAGEAAVPPFALLICMGVWNLMLAQLHAFGCLLNAIERLRIRMLCGSITAVLNIALSIVLVHRFGIVGVTAATVLAFLVADYLPIRVYIRSLLREFRLREHAINVEQSDVEVSGHSNHP
jgi:O-antigen/teichoic acid export membrane protein